METTGARQNEAVVLVLEDQESQRETLTAILEYEGFPVVACGRAEEAVSALAQGTVAAAVVDLRVPDVSTDGLLKALAAWSDRVPVIIHTAFASYESARDALNVGAFAYVEKAGNPEELIRHVHRAFHSRLRSYAEELQRAVDARTHELQDANAALQKSEAKFRSMFENMVAACCLDEMVYEDGKPVDYRIIDVNPSYERIIGISRSAAVGALASELYGTGDAPFLDIYAKVAETGHAASFEAYFAPIGKYLQITSSRPGKGMFSSIFSDITEAKKAKRDLLEYQKRLRSLTSELALAEERERRRIALGLHDQVGQSLAMTKFALQALAQGTDRATAEALHRICGDIDGQVEHVRSLSFELSDSILYEVGFKEAVEAYLDRETQRKHGVACQLIAEGDFSTLKNDTKIVLFRNLRELLSNVVRHSQARRANVRITITTKQLYVSIEDDGVGFDPEDTHHAGDDQVHFGLFSVAEQLKFLGGRLEVHSAPGQGTRIAMIVPL